MNDADLLPKLSVRVWAVWLNASAELSAEYRRFLVPEETARADKFAFEHLKRQYEVSQGALRLLLARYTGCEPRQLKFRFGPKGKPSLAANSRLHFNLSNSGEMSLYAFMFDCEIGVDVEELRGSKDLPALAARYFCEAEATQLLSLADEWAMQEAFYRCWTRKEAYIKAIGTGLYLPLDQFQVTLLSEDPPRFVHIGNSAKAADEWTLQHLDPAPGYVGALAYHNRARKVLFHKPVTAHELIEQHKATKDPQTLE